jgi:hypothetical protein
MNSLNFELPKIQPVKNYLLKTLSVFLLAVVCYQQLPAQFISKAEQKLFMQKEDSLKFIARNIVLDSLTAGRMISDSLFVKTLVRTLLLKNSFYYPFDSVKGVSKLYAPDTSFRIITWNISYDDYYHRQRGVIQYRPVNGISRFLPLRDYSEFTAQAADSVRNRTNWIGAVYYNMVKTQHRGKNYYTLFGIDYHSLRSNKKWIEVLTFDEKNEPVFGGPYFSFEKDSLPKPPAYRYSIEYKKDAATLVNFIQDENKILIDHLISETDEPENKWTLVPDGDYEGFRWENGRWVHIEKVFTFKLQDGQAPVGEQLMDTRGNKNEEKLLDKSKKNKTKDNRQPINYDN